jgi:hypothetical protein
VTTVADALDRLKIVKDALESDDAPDDSPLAAVEAWSSVGNLLTVILDATKHDTSREGVMLHCLALDAATLAALAPYVMLATGRESRQSDLCFTAFASTVELLVELYEEAE